MGSFAPLLEAGQRLAQSPKQEAADDEPVYNGVQNLGGPVDPISSLDVNVPVVTEPYHTAVIRANANLSTAIMYLHQAGQFMEAAAKAMAGVSSEAKDELVSISRQVNLLHKESLDIVQKVAKDR